MIEAERAIDSAPEVREHVRRIVRNKVDVDVWSPSGQKPIYDWEDVEVPGILSEETELALVRAGRSELLAGRAAYYDQERPGGMLLPSRCNRSGHPCRTSHPPLASSV